MFVLLRRRRLNTDIAVSGGNLGDTRCLGRCAANRGGTSSRRIGLNGANIESPTQVVVGIVRLILGMDSDAIDFPLVDAMGEVTSSFRVAPIHFGR